MRERRQIVELWQRGNAVALATLIRVEGSSYRRTGARLLIAANGDYAGSISGGCLEAEVLRKAQWLARNGATIQHYSTLFDDTADIPYGLGCGGTVDILIEPANTLEFTALMQAFEASLLGETFIIATHLPIDGHPLHRSIQTRDSQLETRNSTPDIFPEQAALFTETIEPPQRLLIFGAGDDAQPIVSMAALLGWTVIVIDGRAQWATPERFPEAERVLTTSSGVWTLGPGPWPLSSRDAVIVMTHSYEQDRAWLTAVLPQNPRYLGLLGSRHRSALLVSEVAARLDWPIDRVCEGLFAPIGLDLGGDGAEAIALATLAEIQACIEGKLGTSRRMTPELIAQQLTKGGTSQYLQAQCPLASI